METTVQEVADALRVNPFTVIRWLNQDRNASAVSYAVLDTEELCAVVDIDHKNLIAFLSEYDMAITEVEGAALFGIRRSRDLKKHVRPALKTYRLLRYSLRSVALAKIKRMEKNNEAAELLPGCAILPAADTIPGFSAIKS